MPATNPKFTTRPVNEIEMRPPPTCEVCHLAMWWYGSTEGWGCPVPSGDPDCDSKLYRPKLNPTDRWPSGAVPGAKLMSAARKPKPVGDQLRASYRLGPTTMTTPPPRSSLHVRMPHDLIDRLREVADEQRASLNTYVITVLAGAVEWKPNKEAPAPVATAGGTTAQEDSHEQQQQRT